MGKVARAMGMDPALATHVLMIRKLHSMQEITQLRDTADALASSGRNPAATR